MSLSEALLLFQLIAMIVFGILGYIDVYKRQIIGFVTIPLTFWKISSDPRNHLGSVRQETQSAPACS